MPRFVNFLPAFAACLALMLSACVTPPVEEAAKTPPAVAEVPQKSLKAASFADLPGWGADTLKEAWPAFLYSCRSLKKQDAWREICVAAQQVDAESESDIRAFLEDSLAPWQIVLTDGTESGRITGYYEPLLEGSRQPKDAFRTPLYRVPEDMVVVDLASLYPKLKGMRLRGRLEGRRLVPYLSRADIRQGDHLAGQEIVWVNDAVDAFFLEVQGSGRVHIAETDETIRLAYGDQNGHPYRSIGRYLVDKGEMALSEASAQGIRKWLAAHPDRFDEVLNANPSYVFFREEKLDDPAIGPKGALGVPLTGARSVAVDPRYISLGMPLFIDTTEPNRTTPLQRLVMAQDTGGAIKGVLRLDYFWGFGQAAGEQAGKMKQSVRIWLLQPKITPEKTIR
ncbi:MAG: MltA domain-containing protein [Burkholderiaceae bacterium]|jgi:membrane-bound lytic murein transglycosylase A|nr:MltA domain-containing protein [Burkholderiaceae bacterium]